MRRLTGYIFIAVIIVSFASCSAYKQSRLFEVDGEFKYDKFHEDSLHAVRNYEIQTADYLDIRVYTNDGEAIVDPSGLVSQSNRGSRGSNSQNDQFQRSGYLVQVDGQVKLPLVGKVDAAGKTLHEFEGQLEKAYAEYYVEPYVRIITTNKRMILLGGLGGQVVPLNNENTSLLEVLAGAGGILMDGRSYNIKLLRGDLHNPNVYEINLSTLEGMKQANITVKPNDVVYVEPTRRIVYQAISDINPILSFVTTTLTMFIFIQNLGE